MGKGNAPSVMCNNTKSERPVEYGRPQAYANIVKHLPGMYACHQFDCIVPIAVHVTSPAVAHVVYFLTCLGGFLTSRGLSLIIAGKHTWPIGLRIPQPRCSSDHIENHSRFVPATRLCIPHHEPLLRPMRLELGELLGSLAASREDTEDVEADGLGEGPALADDDLVTGLDTESGRDVRGEVLVALLVTGVLGDEVEVFTADNQGACSLLVRCQDQSRHRFQRICPISSVRRITYGASWST